MTSLRSSGSSLAGVRAALLEARMAEEMSDLLRRQGAVPLQRNEITLVHYGERNASLADALTSRGALHHDLCVYEWRLPHDLHPLEELCSREDTPAFRIARRSRQ